MSYLIRNAHFIVIHVPIAMLLFSFIFDAVAAFLKKKDWHTAGLLCLVVGSLGAIAAVMTGPEGERNPLFPTHELLGKITMVFFIVLTLIRLYLQILKKREIGKNVIYLVASFIGVLLVSYTGHLGGQMVHPDRHLTPGQLQNGGHLPRAGADTQQQKQEGNQSKTGQQ